MIPTKSLPTLREPERIAFLPRRETMAPLVMSDEVTMNGKDDR